MCALEGCRRWCGELECALLTHTSSEKGCMQSCVGGGVHGTQGLVREDCLEICKCMQAIYKCLGQWFICCNYDTDPQCIVY